MGLALQARSSANLLRCLGYPDSATCQSLPSIPVHTLQLPLLHFLARSPFHSLVQVIACLTQPLVTFSHSTTYFIYPPSPSMFPWPRSAWECCSSAVRALPLLCGGEKWDVQLSEEDIVWISGRCGGEKRMGTDYVQGDGWKRPELSEERNLGEKNSKEKVAWNNALSSYEGGTVCHLWVMRVYMQKHLMSQGSGKPNQQ